MKKLCKTCSVNTISIWKLVLASVLQSDVKCPSCGEIWRARMSGRYRIGMLFFFILVILPCTAFSISIWSAVPLAVALFAFGIIFYYGLRSMIFEKKFDLNRVRT